MSSNNRLGVLLLELPMINCVAGKIKHYTVSLDINGLPFLQNDTLCSHSSLRSNRSVESLVVVAQAVRPTEIKYLWHDLNI